MNLGTIGPDDSDISPAYAGRIYIFIKEELFYENA